MAAKQGFTAQISQASEDAKRAMLNRAPNSIKSHSWLSNLNTTCTIKSAPPRTPEVMTMLGVKSGWLVKRNEQHVWQRRWCCVVPHTFLYYFEAEPIMEGDFDEDGNPIVPTTKGRSGGVVDNQDKLNAAVRFGFGRHSNDKRSSYYPSLHMYQSSANKDGGPQSPSHHHSTSANDTSFESPGTSSLIIGPPPPPVDTTRGPNAPAYSNLQPVGIIDLECYTNVNRSNVNELVFEVTGDEITNPDLRSFYFMAGSAEECETWTKALLSDRHSSLRDEREAYRQVCDSFPIQLQQCSDLIDAAEQKAEEAEKEAYHIRSAAEEGRRRVAELVRELLDRDYWGPASNENTSEASPAQQNVSWRSAQSPKGAKVASSSHSSPTSVEHQRRTADAKLDAARKAYIAQLDELVSSANTVMSGGVIPVVQLLTDYVTSIVSSNVELRGEIGSLEQQLRRHDHSDRAAAADLRAQIEQMEHERIADRHREDKRVEELQAQLDQAKRTTEDLENQLQTQRMDFTMYQNQTKGKVSELVQHKKILKKEVIDLRKKVDEIGSERDAALHRIDNLSSKIETERERQRLLESYVEKVESQVRVQQNMMEMMSQGGGNSVVGRVVGGNNGGDGGSVHEGVGPLSVHGDMSFAGGGGGGTAVRSPSFTSGMPTNMDYRSQQPQSNGPSDSHPPLPPRPTDSPISHKPPASPSVSQLPKGFRTVEAPPTPTSAFPRNHSHVVAADLSISGYPDHEDHGRDPADEGEAIPAESANGGKEHLTLRAPQSQAEMASLADVLSDHMDSSPPNGNEVRVGKPDSFPAQQPHASSGVSGSGVDKKELPEGPVTLSPSTRSKKVPLIRAPALDLDVPRGDSGRSFAREANDSGLTRAFDNTKKGSDGISRQISVESKNTNLEGPPPVEGTTTIEGHDPDSADRRHGGRNENMGGTPEERRRGPTLDSPSPHEVKMRRFHRALALKRGSANAAMGQPISRADVVPPEPVIDPMMTPTQERVMQDNDISYESPSPHRTKESTPPAEQSFMSDDLDEMDSRSHISELTEDRTQREIEKVAKQHAWAAIRSRTDLSVEDNRLPPRGAPPSSLQGVNKSLDDGYGRREDADRRLGAESGDNFIDPNSKNHPTGRGRSRGEKEGQYPPTYILGGGRSGGNGAGGGEADGGEAPQREDQWKDETPMRSHLGTIDMKSPVQAPRPAGLPPQGSRGDGFSRPAGGTSNPNNNGGAPPASWSVGSDGKGPARMGSFEDRSMGGSGGSFGSASGGKKLSVAQRARMEADSPSVGSGTLLIRVPSSNSVNQYGEGQQQQQQQQQPQTPPTQGHETSSAASLPLKPRPVSPTPSARSFFSGWGRSITEALDMGGKANDDELSKSGLGSITNTISKGTASPEERRQRDQLVQEISTPLAKRRQIQREKQMAFLREKGLIAEGKGGSGTDTRSLASTTASMTTP